MKDIKIGLTGKLRSGKTTVADYLEEKYRMIPFAFGDELKKGFHKDYPHIPRTPKPREGYQMYGQLMRFVYGENLWVDKCFKEIEYTAKMAKAYSEGNSDITFMPLVTDIRQPNEFARCKREGFFIIRIESSEETRIQRAKAVSDNFKEEDLHHETENYIDFFDCDFTIQNEGTTEELYKRIDIVLDMIKTNAELYD